MGKKLHIISLDIPYPADYGGVIDIFYKLKYLHKEGIDITLHCFQYGNRTSSPELNKYCHEVFYYPRITGWKGLHTSLPYIISSRQSGRLLANLQNDDSPILFEGLHTTFYASHPSLINRKKILRAHNVESDYYAKLAVNTSNPFKQLYYSFEANRLKLVERNLDVFDFILSISEQDYTFFKVKYPAIQHLLIPAFHPNDQVDIKSGSGVYCLYHGNLSVAENIRAVNYLVNEIFNLSNIPLIIAGKNPEQALLSCSTKNISIIPNPSESALHKLIQDAHIHVLPSFQHTGLKLKLLQALFNGRHCLLDDIKTESQFAKTVHFAASKDEFIQNINELMYQPFMESDIVQRKEALRFYDNAIHAAAIASLL